jgi:hypothetical protein
MSTGFWVRYKFDDFLSFFAPKGVEFSHDGPGSLAEGSRCWAIEFFFGDQPRLGKLITTD